MARLGWMTVLLMLGAGWLAGSLFAADKPKGPETGKPWAVPDLDCDLLPVAAGEFRMGDDAGLRWEKPAHSVRLTKPFWLGRLELTNEPYRHFLSESRYDGKARADEDYLRHLSGGASADNDQPIIYVSWQNAMDFCKWLTERELKAGRLPAGYVYRLPTEAEWEYACRAGSTGDYAGDLEDLAWFDKNSGSRSQRGGQRKPNAWGFFDLHGNVFEWCIDWKGEYTDAAASDPVGPAAGEQRLTRGGGWYSPPKHCRSAYRRERLPQSTAADVGFRLALAPAIPGVAPVPPPPPPEKPAEKPAE